MNKKNIISSILGIAAVGLIAPLAEASSAEKIKCHGVSTKWVNDCSASGHNCASHGHNCATVARNDFAPNKWLRMTQKDCDAVKAALKHTAVKDYVLKIRDRSVAASKGGKEF